VSSPELDSDITQSAYEPQFHEQKYISRRQVNNE
jgi:hypothetical protein